MDDKAIIPEAEIEDTPAHLALATTRPEAPALQLLEAMDDAEFEERIVGLRKSQERIARVHREVLVEGTDYGKVRGAPRDFMFKAGAEKLCRLYNLVSAFKVDTRIGDGVHEPSLLVVVTCRLHYGSETGPVVGSGLGSANSWETKHRWRNARPTCPTCAKDLRRSKDPGQAPWYCWAKMGGCGWTGSIDTSVLGRIENPEPWELHNTLAKMAEKRAHVDATLRTTATSGLFGQDEDAVEARDDDGSPAPKEDRVATARKAQDAAKSKGKASTAAPAMSEKDQKLVEKTLAKFGTYTTTDEFMVWADNVAEDVEWNDASDPCKEMIRRAWKTGAEAIATKGAA